MSHNSYIKMNSKWITNLSVKLKTKKLEENLGEKSLWSCIRQRFLRNNNKSIKEKVIIWISSK